MVHQRSLNPSGTLDLRWTSAPVSSSVGNKTHRAISEPQVLLTMPWGRYSIQSMVLQCLQRMLPPAWQGSPLVIDLSIATTMWSVGSGYEGLGALDAKYRLGLAQAKALSARSCILFDSYGPSHNSH